MTAAGILILYIIYGIIILGGLFFVWKIFISKTIWRKILFTIYSISCLALLVFMESRKKANNKRASLKFVGTYNLTKYPNCDSCKAILKDNNSFQVISYKTKDTILEKGSWHYVAYGDFLGVFMDKNEKTMLGSGRFDYSYYYDRHNRLIKKTVGP